MVSQMKNTATKGKTDKIDFIKIKHLYALKVKVKSLSRVRLFATPWGVAHQVSPSMGVSRQEYWSGLPFPSPGDIPTQGSNPGLQHCGRLSTIRATGKPLKKKSKDRLNRYGKSIRQNSILIHNKNFHQSGYKGNISQHNKGHLRQTQS